MALRIKKSPTRRHIGQVSRKYHKKIFIVCEGDKTEIRYFQGLKDNSKELGISDLLEIVVMEKGAHSKGTSDPAGLVRLANEKIKKLKYDDDGVYNEQTDKFLIVMDRDKDSFPDYDDFINKNKDNFILGITNPCFELWLLLHQKDSLESIINPNYEDILDNARVSTNHTFISNLVSEEFNMNPKRGMRFSRFKDNLHYAIEQESKMEQDLYKLKNTVGSNIGQIIKKEML